MNVLTKLRQLFTDIKVKDGNQKSPERLSININLLKQAFCELQRENTSNQKINLDTKLKIAQWVKLNFQEFYSHDGDESLNNFYKTLTFEIGEILRQQAIHTVESTAAKILAEQLLRTCERVDNPSIGHHLIWKIRTPRGRTRTGTISATLQVQVLRILVESCTQLRLAQINDSLTMTATLVEYFPSVMVESSQLSGLAAWLLLGEMQLERDRVDEAIASAKKILSENSTDMDAQTLLLRAYQIKSQRGECVPQREIALYDLRNYFCSKPFEILSTGPLGEVFPCSCPAWLPFPTGNILEAQSPDEVWNSEAAIEIRRSILDGDFTYCSRMLCPMITGKTLPKKAEVTDPVMRSYIDNHTTVLDKVSQVVLSHDSTCNLACPSCRPEVMAANATEQQKLAEAKERVITPLLKKVTQWVFMTTDGDPFASQHYRSILADFNREEYPTLILSLQTNGLLFTPQQWERLPGIHDMVYSVRVSIDAATAKTYEKLRFPGRWSNLMPNLEFIAKLRKAEVIKNFGLNFVVQEANFREMPAFVELGMILGVDVIAFQRILNFGLYETGQFLDVDVADPRHPLYKELLEIIHQPLLQESIVDLHTLFPKNTLAIDR